MTRPLDSADPTQTSAALCGWRNRPCRPPSAPHLPLRPVHRWPARQPLARCWRALIPTRLCRVLDRLRIPYHAAKSDLSNGEHLFQWRAPFQWRALRKQGHLTGGPEHYLTKVMPRPAQEIRRLEAAASPNGFRSMQRRLSVGAAAAGPSRSDFASKVAPLSLTRLSLTLRSRRRTVAEGVDTCTHEVRLG